MKILTSHQFVRAIIKKDNGIQRISAAKVYTFIERASAQHIECHLGGGSFEDLVADYPNQLTLSRRELVIKSPEKKDLLQKLDRQLRFVNDEDLDKIIYDLWKTL